MALNGQDLFFASQLLVGGGLTWFAFRRFFGESTKSNFRVRESDLRKDQPLSQDQSLAQAKLSRKETLQLGGIRIDAPPHEILGVQRSASTSEIQKAYRNLMKQYHPDKIGQPGTREWKDAQKIAEAINRAKEELIRNSKP